MTNQTITPEADGSPQKLMLYELAFRLVPVHCQRHDEAIDVQDGGPIPPEWQSEFEKRRVDSVKRELAARLSEFDLSDPFIASHYLGVPGTKLDAWKECTPDWEDRIAQVRKKERRKYEADNRKAVENRAPSRVASQMAGERAEAATIAIEQALRREMMATTSIVRATSDRGEPRELNRAEIAEAEIDHVRNKLEVDGRWWCNVEVECKWLARMAGPTSAAPKSDAEKPKSNAGRKRVLRDRTITFLRPRYPKGKPDAVSYDMIRAEMEAADASLKPSDKTIRVAFADLVGEQAK